MKTVLAVVLAAAASSLFALSTSLQALEARETPSETALRASLLVRLVRRPRWLIGTLAGVGAWPLQAAALALASVALVQPTFGFGLIVLLLLGVFMLHERVGRREIAGVTAVVAAVALLGWAAPSAGAYTWVGTAVVIVWLGVTLAAPTVLRLTGHAGGLVTSIVAGLAWGWVGLGTSLFDDAVGDRRWPLVLAWGAGVGAASWGGLLSEMTALQSWPATRAVPIAFALEMILPAAAVTVLTNAGAGPAHGVPFAVGLVIAGAGAALLGGSSTVAKTVHRQVITEP